MIKGKTESGFEFEVDKNAMNDMRVLDAIVEIDSGADPLSLSFLVSRILGKEGKENLYKHLEKEDGRVPIEDVSTEIIEIFGAMGDDGKNS